MKEFLVVYDYGTGGVWGIAKASSADEVTALFPELQIVSEETAWMSEKRLAKIREVSTFVVGDESTYPQWLQGLEQGR
jgi:hypothetical protein